MSETVSDTLAAEAEQRPRVGRAAIAAGVLNLAGGLASWLLTQSAPSGDEKVITVTESLQSRVVDGRATPQGLYAQQIIYIGDHAVAFIAGGVLVAVASVLLLLPLGYLFRAIRARNPRFGRAAIIAAVAGAVLAGVGMLAYTVAFALEAASFTDAQVQTSGAARDAVGGGTVLAGQALLLVGRFALALAFVMIALNAMRVGLLTRFLGVLGILVGVTFVIPVDQPGIVRSFWLVVVGLLILGKLPSGRLPAWQSGEAVPWPSRQQMREQAEALAPPEPVAAEAGTPHPSSKKRKRKRRT